MSPQRVQLSRKRGWRKPHGAIVVSRPSRWGNPFQIIPVGGFHEVHFHLGLGRPDDDSGWQCVLPTAAGAREVAVARFAAALRDGHLLYNAAHVRAELAGRDLACWCPAASPCHADVLLDVANGGAR